jgi:ABC-2 type transport system ATP-binding protein
MTTSAVKTHQTTILSERVGQRLGSRYALQDINLEVRAGTVLGLIGPNGSGKTTLLKLMAGFLKPTFGSLRVFGRDPYRHRAQIMRRTRFAFAPPPTYGALTAGLRKGDRIRDDDIMQALETVGLADRAHDKAATFSFGMKQRLGLAQALLPLPELLVFDEPTDGLDPIAVAELRGILKRLHADYNLTIVLSSHLLSEVEKLVDTLLLLNAGQSIYCGSPAGLLEGRRRIEIRFAGDLQAGMDTLRQQGLEPERNGDQRIFLPAGSIRLPDAAKLLGDRGLELIEFHEKQPELEDVYRKRLEESLERVKP